MIDILCITLEAMRGCDGDVVIISLICDEYRSSKTTLPNSVTFQMYAAENETARYWQYTHYQDKPSSYTLLDLFHYQIIIFESDELYAVVIFVCQQNLNGRIRS